jgi:hypothetical protein
MKFTALFALLFILFSSTLFAALGETETEILKHYGKPVTTPFSLTNQDMTEYFQYKDFFIGVTFIGGQCQREILTKKDKGAFTAKEIQMFLDASTNGAKWIQVNDNETVKIWVQDSKAAFAGYYKVHPYLSLETRVMMDYEAQLKAIQEKANPGQPAQSRPPGEGPPPMPPMTQPGGAKVPDSQKP